VRLPRWNELPTFVGDRIFVHLLHRGLADTASHTHLQELGAAHDERIDYIPSPWLFVRRMFRGLEVRPDDVFVDFGSGKGRVVYLVARNYRFKRVVGIELTEELNEIARENLARSRSRLRCRDVELITGDATQVPIPSDMTFAYFFNPFVGETFRTVLDNICRSLDELPRRLTLIYANPVERATVEENGRFRLIREAGGDGRGADWHRIAVYTNDRGAT
jgi:Histone methylation protein DOT1